MSRDAKAGIQSGIQNNETPVVDCPTGPIVGTVDQKTGVNKFLGIPYCHPPIGDLRWLSPQPMQPWQTPFRAVRFGMPAAQNPSLLMQVQGPCGEPPESEDCLYLNIYAPPKPGTGKLPVMLWVHGGSFYMGSGCQEIYDGCHLAASGRAIVVTFNYRLGAFGFLRLRDICDIPSSGNEGVEDQIAALNWVHRNIAAFGGDPDNITLFGESAGAMSIATLLAAPGCRGLFKRAIVQSGNPHALHTPRRANNLALAFVEHLERICGHQPLRKASTKSLLQAQHAVMTDPRMERSWGQLPFKPVLDGKLLDADPLEALARKRASGVTLLLGSNLDEWNLFSAITPETFTLDNKKIRARLEWLFPHHLLAPLLKHYYRLARSQEENPWPEWPRTWNLLLTDMVFTVPGIRLLKAHCDDCYHYHFAQPLAAQPLLGACHAVELGYVFGTYGAESLRPLYGAEANPHRLSGAMQKAWLNFAECGDPGAEWLDFGSGHSRRFGDHPRARPFDAAELTALWQDIPDNLLNGYL
ncbi:carboxylesterase/lipase family protein [Microbulbifer thermotolerans]|uniref:carboxylesterase/lipase family protein n=1 Tax=Microbulbifer thermotolerans TaxID=252514 RepID=UPI00224905F3|nr:carboxylesterase/lipase family protein [Microbulbifer thermotolerans]MCX2794781.1 carboxylesterase/lipase family protein [Microbulbifer thermotolerans]MCX2834613.1 carboxylesterase/lipase family protein [Microbulbifer thermotolerans]